MCLDVDQVWECLQDLFFYLQVMAGRHGWGSFKTHWQYLFCFIKDAKENELEFYVLRKLNCN